MSLYNRTISERGIPNDIYHYLDPQDAADEFEQFLWCDKVGGKVYCFGHCEDSYSDISKHENRAKKKRRNKRERDLKHKNRLKYLAENSSGYPSPAIYVDEIWVKGYGYVENPKPYYKRLYRGKLSKYLKRQSNKKIRRYKGELHNGWYCHKVFDFWCKLYFHFKLFWRWENEKECCFLYMFFDITFYLCSTFTYYIKRKRRDKGK